MSGKLTAKEFANLPDEEKRKRYKELSNHEAYLYRVAYDIPDFKVVGKGEITDEDRRKLEEGKKRLLKHIENRSK